MSNRVILPELTPEPIAEFKLSVDTLEEMLKNAKAGGAVIILVYPDRAGVELR